MLFVSVSVTTLKIHDDPNDPIDTTDPIDLNDLNDPNNLNDPIDLLMTGSFADD